MASIWKHLCAVLSVARAKRVKSSLAMRIYFWQCTFLGFKHANLKQKNPTLTAFFTHLPNESISNRLCRCIQDDCLVKVWYSPSKWKFSIPRVFTPQDPNPSVQGKLSFSFVYLAHPRSVTGFSWRKTSMYMPRYWNS